MPSTARAMPARMIHQVTSSQMASATWPACTLRTTLMIMPVMIWIRPKAREPTRMASVSLRGVNRAGSSVSVVLGLMILANWGIKSPRKPPVSAPMIKVLMPHSSSRPAKSRIPPLGRMTRNIKTAPRTIKMPYAISAIISPKKKMKKGAISGLGSTPS